jgi:hypothetical protein
MPRRRLKSSHYLLLIPPILTLEIRYYTLSHNFAHCESFKMQKTMVDFPYDGPLHNHSKQRLHDVRVHYAATVSWRCVCDLTLSLLMLHICGVSKTFGELYQKTNKTEDTTKLTLLAFKITIILHNTRLAVTHHTSHVLVLPPPYGGNNRTCDSCSAIAY